MSWSVYQKADCNYVAGVLEGITSWQDIKDLTTQCIAMQKEQGIFKFLIETTEMQPLATVSDIIELPASVYQIKNVDRQTRIAVVYSPSGASEEIVKFYETACMNRGWRAKRFTSQQEAISWLLK
jgi:hypothetical protein